MIFSESSCAPSNTKIVERKDESKNKSIVSDHIDSMRWSGGQKEIELRKELQSIN